MDETEVDGSRGCDEGIHQLVPSRSSWRPPSSSTGDHAPAMMASATRGRPGCSRALANRLGPRRLSFNASAKHGQDVLPAPKQEVSSCTPA
jgi:hypothetical protein